MRTSCLVLHILFTIALAAPQAARAQLRPAPALPESPCRAAIAAAERMSGVPDRLLQAVSIVESGRRGPSGAVVAWPWTINVEGAGSWFETKAEALAAVAAHRARGARSIDVGCMQVNLLHHPDAFASLDEAFDPAANSRYAALFIGRLLAQTGSWPRAVAAYHSLTPDIGAEYARKVLAVWAQPEPGRTPPSPGRPSPAGPGQASLPPSFPSPGTTASLPAPARLPAVQGSAGPGLTGRGLDSYRALPTRAVAFATLPRRS